MTDQPAAGHPAGGDPAPSVQAMTTQVTASTEVVRPAASARVFDEWGAVAYVFGMIAAVVMLAAGILSIVDRILAWRRAGETEDQGEYDKLDKRMSALEVTCRDYMPRREIEGGFGHEKQNRRADLQAVTIRMDKTDTRLGDVERAQTRMETQLAGTNASLQRVEQKVDRLGERMDEKLDRIIAAGTNAPARA